MRRLLMIIGIGTSLASVSLSISAQQKPQVSCPTIEIRGPDLGTNKRPLIYSVVLNDLSPSLKPTFEWDVSSGKIADGQGTEKVAVELGDADSFTITITLRGNLSSTSDSMSACELRSKRLNRDHTPV